MDMDHLFEKIQCTPRCRTLPPSGLPRLTDNPNHVLPEDVRRFYELCGGVYFYEGSMPSYVIGPPQDVVLSNLRLRSGLVEEYAVLQRDGSMKWRDTSGQIYDDISWDWYIICDIYDGNYISIDFHKNRLGRCYESFWDTHGVSGSSAIIATSFTHLLQQILDSEDKWFFWHEPDFSSLGDAYN